MASALTSSVMRNVVLGASVFFFACASGDPKDNLPDPYEFIPSVPNPTPVAVAPLAEGVTTLAGYSEPGDFDGPRGHAFFDNPVNVLAVGDQVFVADFYNGRIVQIAPDGNAETVVRQDSFDRPFGMLLLDESTLLIQTDRNTSGGLNGALWRYDMPSKTITLVADEIGRPRFMVKMNDGRIVAVDYEKHVVEFLDPDTGAVTPFAGSAGQAGYVDGNGSAARFNEPRALVAVSDTEVVLVDRLNHVLRKVSMNGDVSTWAGSNESGNADGGRAEARFFEPLSLARGPDGSLYVGDGNNFRIRKITPDDTSAPVGTVGRSLLEEGADAPGMVSTLAGTGEAGYRDDSLPTNAQFRGMEGIHVSTDGRFLYVADGARGRQEQFNRIRRVTLQ